MIAKSNIKIKFMKTQEILNDGGRKQIKGATWDNLGNEKRREVETKVVVKKSGRIIPK